MMSIVPAMLVRECLAPLQQQVAYHQTQWKIHDV